MRVKSQAGTAVMKKRSKTLWIRLPKPMPTRQYKVALGFQYDAKSNMNYLAVKCVARELSRFKIETNYTVRFTGYVDWSVEV